jgi:hypothetical protein
MEPPRIALVHVPKTGGNSLLRALSRIYPPEETARTRRRGDTLENLQGKRFIMGHFGYNFAKTIDAKLVTVLRDPEERIVSVYYHWRRIPAESGPHARLAKQLTLDEFLSSQVAGIVTTIRDSRTWKNSPSLELLRIQSRWHSISTSRPTSWCAAWAGKM